MGAIPCPHGHYTTVGMADGDNSCLDCGVVFRLKDEAQRFFPEPVVDVPSKPPDSYTYDSAPLYDHLRANCDDPLCEVCKSLMCEVCFGTFTAEDNVTYCCDSKIS
jgi:hypothetical protein